MLLLKTKLKPSKINGIGVFADEFISKGEVVWEPSKQLDIELPEEVFNNLSEKEKEYFLHYGYKDKITKNYYLVFDNTRFINHSNNGNITLDQHSGKLISSIDIPKGDEITEDYSEFESVDSDRSLL